MTGQLGRRRFLTFVVAAPTLTVAARLAPAAAQDAGNVGFPYENWAAALTPLVKGVKDLMVLRVEPDGRIVYELPRCETGQGINTAIAMMIAEELDARLDDLDVPHSDGRPELGVAQLTGWSTTVQNFWDVARELGAEARARLVTAAAHRWNVDASTLTTRDSTVNAPDGRSATYGSLAVDAANVDSPEVSTKPKPVSEHRLIGEPTGRMDARDIVTGKATYTMDLDVPGALPTVVKRPPTLGGRVGTVHNAAEVEAMPGVVAVTTIVSGLGVTKWPTGVAITAHSIHQALQARDALTVSWDPGPIDGMSDEDITQRLRLAVPPMDPPTLLRKSLVGEFDFGFVNHAPVETNCAIADVRPTHADIWLSAKIPLIAQLVVKAFIQRPVTIHVTRGGGSFGRKLYPDVAIEAALTSAAIGKPVKLLWTRDDDMRHGRMRPASHHRIRFTYLGDTVYSLENWSSAVQLDVGFNPFISELLNGVPLPITGAGVFLGTENTPYDFGVSKRWLEEVFLNIPTAMWRAFYAGHNGAAEEISVDRLAGKLGKDPLQFRIEDRKSVV